MNDIKVGDRLEIHCYKHNGKLHRQWDEAVVLEIKDDYIVFGNNKTTVVDSDGRVSGVWHLSNYAILIEPIFYMVFILSSFYHFYVVICYDVWYNYIVGCD